MRVTTIQEAYIRIVSAMSGEEPIERLRIDKWLWCARFYKSRSAAASAVKSGHVRVNDQRAKPSRDIVVGEALRIGKRLLVYEVRVERIPTRRGPVSEAASCYTESAGSIEAREALAAQNRATNLAGGPVTRGRPDKRTRRLMRDRIKG